MTSLWFILTFFAGVFIGAFGYYRKITKHVDEYVGGNSQEFAKNIYEAFKEQGIRVVKVRDQNDDR